MEGAKGGAWMDSLFVHITTNIASHEKYGVSLFRSLPRSAVDSGLYEGAHVFAHGAHAPA
jgi:hypothetical protein